MAMRPMFVKDVRQLSPSHQTYSLEAFHALILHFAPKHTGFSFLGMYSRLLLAALHFNHNSNREVLRSDGEVRHQVRYPRFMKGTAVVRPMKETPSYEYAFDLMEHLHRTYSSTPEELRQSSALLASSAPQPLTASFQKVPKEEAVRQYKALHSRFSSQ
ncbi:unnamed protein product [Knipowitschia caucasica]